MLNQQNLTNKNIKFLREKNKLSQEDLAKKLQINQSTLAKWEKETREVTLKQAIKIANYFEIPIGDFISKDLKSQEIAK